MYNVLTNYFVKRFEFPINYWSADLIDNGKSIARWSKDRAAQTGCDSHGLTADVIVWVALVSGHPVLL